MSCCSSCSSGKCSGNTAFDCFLAQGCHKSTSTKCKAKKPDKCFILKGRCAEEICLQYKPVPNTTIAQTKDIYVDSKTGFKYVVKSVEFPAPPVEFPDLTSYPVFFLLDDQDFGCGCDPCEKVNAPVATAYFCPPATAIM